MSNPTSWNVVIPKNDLAAINIYPLASISEAGVETFSSTAFNVLGYFNSIKLTLIQNNEAAMSTESQYMNRTATWTDYRLELVEWQRRFLSTTTQALITTCVGNNKVKVVFSVGADSSPAQIGTWTAYGLWSQGVTGISGEGPQTNGITIEQYDTSYNASGIAPLSFTQS